MATSEGIPSSIDIEFLELNDNPYVMNVLSVLAAYSFFEKKPSINIDYCIENVDGQLTVIK